MPNLSSPEFKKLSYFSSVVISPIIDAWMVSTMEDGLDARLRVTIASVVVYYLLNSLDRYSTIRAYTKNPTLRDKHPELQDVNFDGDVNQLKLWFKQRNPEVWSYDYTFKGEPKRLVFREREFFWILLAIPWVIVVLTPTKLKAIATNIRNEVTS